MVKYFDCNFRWQSLTKGDNDITPLLLKFKIQLEQLERLRSEDIPRRPMITHTIDSSENKVEVTNWQNLPKLHFFVILHGTHLLMLFDKICKYEMDPASVVEDTERTWFHPEKDRWTDGQGWNQYIPLSSLLKRGYNETCIHKARIFYSDLDIIFYHL